MVGADAYMYVAYSTAAYKTVDAGKTWKEQIQFDVEHVKDFTPLSKIIVNGLPGRKFMRRHPPGTTTTKNMENRIGALTNGDRSGSTARFWQ